MLGGNAAASAGAPIIFRNVRRFEFSMIHLLDMKWSRGVRLAAAR
jgi:hypothetical protein